MKCSRVYGFGMLGVGVYTLGILIPGAIEMSYYGRINDSAQKSLDEATNIYNAANADYLDNQNKIYDAQNIISDAQCYINNNQNFALQLQSYCLNAVPSANSLNMLVANYGIQVVYLPDSVSSSVVHSSYQVCSTPAPTPRSTPAPTPKCTNIAGCQTTSQTTCTSIPYGFTQYTHEYRGTMAQGPGSQVMLPCGRFSYSLASSTQITSTTTAWISSYGYSGQRIIEQNRDRYYTSKVVISFGVNSASITGTVEFNLNPAETNLFVAANSILNLIRQQCDFLKNSIKPVSNYYQVVNDTTQLLVSLRASAQIKQGILNDTMVYKNQQQLLFDQANAPYRHSLLLWLTLLFIPTSVVTCCLCWVEGGYQEKDYKDVSTCDTDKPGECLPANPFKGGFHLFKSQSSRVVLEDHDLRPNLGQSQPNQNGLPYATNDLEAGLNIQSEGMETTNTYVEPSSNFYTPQANNLLPVASVISAEQANPGEVIFQATVVNDVSDNRNEVSERKLVLQ